MNLSFQDPAVIVTVTVVIVVIINLAIYFSLAKSKQSNSVGQIELLRRAAKRARNPWEQEDADLRELSELAGRLRAAHLAPDREKESRVEGNGGRPAV